MDAYSIHVKRIREKQSLLSHLHFFRNNFFMIGKSYLLTFQETHSTLFRMMLVKVAINVFM